MKIAFVIALALLLAFTGNVFADPGEITAMSGTIEIGIYPDQSEAYLRTPFPVSYCATPDFEIIQTAGPEYDWGVSILNNSGFVITVTRDTTGVRESMRFDYTASGEAWPCSAFSNHLYLPLIIE